MSEDHLTRIRGHHLICLNFFHGDGLGSDYGRNLLHVIRNLTEEGGVAVIGPDDVCTHCPSFMKGECCRLPEHEDQVRVLDALALELLGISPDERFDFGEATVWLPRILERWHALACDGCEWESRCAGPISQHTQYPSGR